MDRERREWFKPTGTNVRRVPPAVLL